MDDIVSWLRVDYKSWTVWPKITEDGNSLQDKQWTPTGPGPMVPGEEEEEEEEVTVGTESPLTETVIDVAIRLLARRRCTIGLSFCELTLIKLYCLVCIF